MMASFAWRAFAILALLTVCLDMSPRTLCVQADDAADPAPAPAEGGDVAVEAGEAKDEDGKETVDLVGGDEEKGQQFVDSARELQEKLAQLKALLDAKGEGADPGLKEKLSGLEGQLKDLGLDALTGGGSGAANPELTEFLGACLAMSMRRAGMQRPATLGALRKLVENKLAPEEAAKNEFWRMVAVCVGEMKEDEYSDFKAGKMKILPKVYVDESKKPEAEKKVLEIESQVWDELRKVSEGLLKEMAGPPQEKPPMKIAYLAMIPVGLGVAFLVKMFLDMQNRASEADAKKAAKKEAKKAK